MNAFEIPPAFRLDRLPESLPSYADPPDDVWATGQKIPIERWIFGQYNKLLPAKASCRALAHLLAAEPRGFSLEDAAREIAGEAALLGDYLTHLDNANNNARDDALSTAFPSTGENSDKSRLRYANQFVASVNKQGQVSGLLIDLKLINAKGRSTKSLMLTEAGWQFAVMPNPVLDGSRPISNERFSQHERAYLLKHITASVPAEDFAYRAILSAVLQGANTPDALDAALLECHSPGDLRGLSKSFLSSQRSGAISRMTDLALAERVREGVRVSYVVTDSGDRYLQNSL